MYLAHYNMMGENPWSDHSMLYKTVREVTERIVTLSEQGPKHLKSS